MLNLALQYYSIWYATKHQPNHALVVNIFPTLFLVTYTIVVAYHVAYVCDITDKLSQVYYTIRNLISKHLSPHTIQENTPLLNDTDSFNGSFSDLREPTLSL